MDTNNNHKELSFVIYISLSICKELRQAMLRYCEVPDKEHRNNVLMDFVRRIECNLYAVAVLAKQTRKKGSGVYLKLPINIILRNCFMDSLQGLYYKTLDDTEFEEEVKILNRDYVNSFQYRQPVYNDILAEFGMEEFADSYLLSLEDNYAEYLAFDKGLNEKGLWSCIGNADIRCSHAATKPTIESIYRKLKENNELSTLADKIFAYYKYFSQYEHFSEYSHGDSLAPYKEDNVSFPCALNTLRNSVESLIQGILVM